MIGIAIFIDPAFVAAPLILAHLVRFHSILPICIKADSTPRFFQKVMFFRPKISGEGIHLEMC